MDGGVFGFISTDIINIVIFSGDITLRILLINPFKDYVAAVPLDLFFREIHGRSALRLQRGRAAGYRGDDGQLVAVPPEGLAAVDHQQLLVLFEHVDPVGQEVRRP